MPRTLILIPTSRFVSHEMQIEVGKVPPVLIPISGKPLLRFIVDQYRDLPDDKTFGVIVSEGSEMIEAQLAHLNLAQTESVQLLKISLTEQLGEAIRLALAQVDIASFDNLIIHFGDTLVLADFAGHQDTILCFDLEESFRWATFKTKDGRISAILDKQQAEYLDMNHVFVGWFYLMRPCLFYDKLCCCPSHPGLDSFYAALMEYLAAVDYQLLPASHWLDFGHVDNYYQAKKKFVNKRFFNQIEIDESRAIIKKNQPE